jgi:V8-like Glu-specific endopeptidase
MMLDSVLRIRPAMLVLVSLFLGCAATGDPSIDEDSDETQAGGQQSPIVNGTKATAYPEAALIDFGSNGQISYACSGALIAPRVVLTAGHCIEGTDWYVTLPFSGNQKSHGKGVLLDYKPGGQSVDPNAHDVGLIILDTPLSIASWPLVATAAVPNATKGQNIGRIDNGTFSNTALFIGAPISLSDAKSSGFPYDYITDQIIQPGDSGGPVVVAGTHNIVAVNSGAGGGTEVLARVDLVNAWIKQIVAANGGGGNFGDPNGGGGGGAGGGSGGGSNGGAGGSGGGVPSGNTEAEPNDTYQQTNPLSGQLKGSLTASDQDWFTWTVGSSGVKYNLTVQATGNAQVQQWKLVNGQYYQTTNTSATQISQTSTGPGKYFVVVFSPNGTKQDYTLTLQK